MKNNKALKICLLIIDFLPMLVGIALILLNKSVINTPDWLPAVLCAISVVGIIAYITIYQTKLVLKIILLIIIVSASIVTSLYPYVYPYWNAYNFKEYTGVQLNFDEIITYDEAIEDLDFAMHFLQKVHPMFMHGLTEEIKRGYEASVERLKNDDLITVNDLSREIQSIVNPMHDAHTHTSSYYPDDRYLKVAPKIKYDDLRIVSINGISTDEIIELAKQYTSYETEAAVDFNYGRLSGFDLYGISAPFTFVLSDSNGNTITEVYTEEDFVSYSEYMEIYYKYFPQTEEEQEFVYYKIDEEKNLAVLTLTQCIHNQTYIDCVDKMFSEINEKGIQNIAVDLRSNSGGSTLVANKFISFLPIDSYYSITFSQRYGFFTRNLGGTISNPKQTDLLFNGNVYILTNSSTFSAAADFAMLIQDNGLGKVIGQSPGNAANSYTEIAVFYLPNTGLPIQISTKKSKRANPEITDDFVIPDYPCDSREVFETLYSLL